VSHKKGTSDSLRQEIVSLGSAGIGQREIARRLRVSQPTVQRWLTRPPEVDGSLPDRVSGRASNRVTPDVERRILDSRSRLTTSALGETGSEAIHRDLTERGETPPSVSTIGRVLVRSGALDGKKRTRRPPPPQGWYLPDVAAHLAELDQFDAVVGLVIRGGVDVEVLNAVSLHGGLIGSWPLPSVTTDSTLLRLEEHWREFGLPVYAQFDNDTRFQGAHQFKDSLGRVARLCLSLGVTPVFAPPREQGVQNAIESLNARWQSKVWNRWEHADLEELQNRSDAYVAASRKRHARRIEAAPERHGFPPEWKVKPRFPLKGKVIFLRRSDDQGRVSLLGRTFDVDPQRPHRLVRAEVHFDENRIDFHALRRADPTHQPILAQIVYIHPNPN
jgi:hypothetical protein